MDEFVQAVLNFTRGSPEQRILAEKYLISKEKSPQFYPVAVQILQYVPEQQNLLVDKNFLYFYAIKVIETVTRDQATFSHEARTDTVNFLLSWAEKQPPGIAMKKAVQVAVVLAISNEMFFPAFYPQTVLSLASHNSISAKISSLLFINELNLNLFDKGPNSNLLDLSEKVV
ncbi:exportin T, putative, partial [Entamoeba invadens IP1]